MKRALILALVAFLVAGCTRARNVRIVVPTETFVGQLVVEEALDGVDLVQEEGRYVLRFTASARLVVRDGDFLSGWKQYECRTPSGGAIPVRSIEMKDGSERALWPMGTRYDLDPSGSRVTRTRHRFFVGTRAELDNELNRDKEGKQPNQALQTTPVTRSVVEKTIEFGHHRRGV